MPAPHSSEHSPFQRVRDAQDAFYKDRPSVLLFNRGGTNDIELLSGEVEELQASPEYGLSEQEYRAQELSDVWLFARNMLNRYDQEVDEAHILSRSSQLTGRVAPVQETEVAQFEPKYQETIVQLNAVMEGLRECCARGEKSPQLVEGLQEVIAHTTALFHLIGKDPASSCMEKIARNMLKYQAVELGVNVDYAQVSPGIKDRWKAQKGDQRFFGPLDEPLTDPNFSKEKKRTQLPVRTAKQELATVLMSVFASIPQPLFILLDRIELLAVQLENEFSWRDLPRGLKFASVKVAKGIGNRLR